MVMMPVTVAKSVAQMVLYTMRKMDAAVNVGARCSANGDSRMAGMTLMAYMMG